MIAGELLVRALAVEHHLEPGLSCLAEHGPLREDAGAAVRLVLMPGDTLGFGKSVLVPRIAPMRNGPGALDHGLHEWPFVDRLHVIAGADGVYPRAGSGLVELARHQADDRRAVEPAGKTGPNGHVGAQMEPHRLREQLAKAIEPLPVHQCQACPVRECHTSAAPAAPRRAASAAGRDERIRRLAAAARRRTSFRRYDP